MGMLLSKKLYRRDEHSLMYWCLGCDMFHPVYLSKPPYNPNTDTWTWNGEVEKPTFHPSLNTKLGPGKQCHIFIRDGLIVYLDDCHHHLKGQTIELPDIPEEEL